MDIWQWSFLNETGIYLRFIIHVKTSSLLLFYIIHHGHLETGQFEFPQMKITLSYNVCLRSAAGIFHPKFNFPPALDGHVYLNILCEMCKNSIITADSAPIIVPHYFYMRCCEVCCHLSYFTKTNQIILSHRFRLCIQMQVLPCKLNIWVPYWR